MTIVIDVRKDGVKRCNEPLAICGVVGGNVQGGLAILSEIVNGREYVNKTQRAGSDCIPGCQLRKCFMSQLYFGQFGDGQEVSSLMPILTQSELSLNRER